MFKRVLIEAAKNVARSFWLSATAVMVLTVSLASVALIATLSTTVSFTVRNLDQLVTIAPLISEDFPEERIEELLEKVRSIQGIDVNSVQYFDKEAARQSLIENNRDSLNDEFVQNFGESGDLAFRFIEITPNSPEDYGRVVEGLNAISFDEIENIWESIPQDERFVQNLKTLNQWVRIIGIILILVFASISILVMVNILRITIYSHKDEIEIMRLVGATNNYIRMPFVAEGVYYNFIAAVIVIALFIPALSAILPRIQEFIGVGDFLQASTDLSIQIYITLATTVITGIIVGVITTYLAIQKYLQL
jgi:cell division transport system permease protein